MVEPAPSSRTGTSATWAGALVGIACAAALAIPPGRHLAGAVVAPLAILGAVVLARPRPSPWIVPLTVLFAIVQLRWSLAPGRTVVPVAILASALAAYWAARTLPRRGREIVLAAIGAGGTLAVVLAVLSASGGAAVGTTTVDALDRSLGLSTRLDEGWIGGTHGTAAALGMAAALGLACALATSPRSRPGRGSRVAAACVCAVGTAASGSFAAWLAAGTALWLGSGPPRGPRDRPRLAARALGVAFLVAGLAGALLPPPAAAGSDASPPSPLESRLALWRGAAAAAADVPWTGSGLGSFAALHESVRRPTDPATSSAHGSWQQIASETGLPGTVFLGGCLVWWVRRRRDGEADGGAWPLAALAAFGVHAVFEPSAYDFALVVPAAVLAGIVSGSRTAVAASGEAADGRSAPVIRALLVLAVLASGVVIAGEAAAGRHPGPRGPELAPWSADARTRDVATSLRAPGPPDRARLDAALARLDRLDPRSPVAARLRGDLARDTGRDADAWRAYARAAVRAPVDPSTYERLSGSERALRSRGLLSGNLDYSTDARVAPKGPGPLDAVLLLAHLLIVALVLRPIGAMRSWPTGGAIVVAVVLLSPWGDGGRLSGSELGRAALLATAVLVALGGARGIAGLRRDLPTRWSSALTAILLVTALSGLASPDLAAARAGMISIASAVVVAALSAGVALRRPDWPRVVVRTCGAAAAAAGIVLLIERFRIASSPDSPGFLPAMLWGGGNRPAGDFGHPGHLGTYLVAAGLALVAASAAERIAWPRLAAGAALALVGLGQGARASVLALAAGVAVAASLAVHRTARRALVGVSVVGMLAGGALVILRFTVADPFKWSRIDIWRRSLEAIGTRPIAGFGPGGFAAFGPNFQPAVDSELATRFSWFFDGPHSDVLAVPLSFGLPGGLVVFGALVVLGIAAVRGARATGEHRAWAVGALAGLAALSAHGVVDDLFGPRPAALLAAAALAGALAGRGSASRAREDAVPASGSSFSTVFRVAGGTAVVTLALAFAFVPWLADRVAGLGRADRAAAIDPLGAGYAIRAARTATGSPRDRLALADEHTVRATLAVPGSSLVRIERAELLESALRGPLPTPDTLDAAIASWSRALDLAPHAVLARRARGRLYAYRGDVGLAEADFRRALSDEPNFLGVRVDLVRLLLQAGRPLEARAEAQEALRIAAALRSYVPSGAYERELLTLEPDERRTLEGAS